MIKIRLQLNFCKNHLLSACNSKKYQINLGSIIFNNWILWKPRFIPSTSTSNCNDSMVLKCFSENLLKEKRVKLIHMINHIRILHYIHKRSTNWKFGKTIQMERIIQAIQLWQWDIHNKAKIKSKTTIQFAFINIIDWSNWIN